MHTRKQWQITAVALALCAGTLVPSSFGIVNTVTNLYEFFDSGTVGSPPAGWLQGGSQGFAVVTNNLFQSSPNSLVLFSTNSPNPAYALGVLSPSISATYDERVWAGFRLNPTQTDAALNVLFTDASTIPFLTISFNNAGQITAGTSGGPVALGSYSAGQWYDVQLLFTPLANTYSVEVRTNDMLQSSASGLPVQFDVGFTYFYLQSFGKIGETTSAYFDNVFVIVPEPTTAVLAGAGLLGLTMIRRRR